MGISRLFRAAFIAHTASALLLLAGCSAKKAAAPGKPPAAAHAEAPKRFDPTWWILGLLGALVAVAGLFDLWKLAVPELAEWRERRSVARLPI